MTTRRLRMSPLSCKPITRVATRTVFVSTSRTSFPLAAASTADATYGPTPGRAVSASVFKGTRPWCCLRMVLAASWSVVARHRNPNGSSIRATVDFLARAIDPGVGNRSITFGRCSATWSARVRRRSISARKTNHGSRRCLHGKERPWFRCQRRSRVRRFRPVFSVWLRFLT